MFKTNYPIEKRKLVSAQMNEKYPERVPIIVEPTDPKRLSKKFLSPKEHTVSQFLAHMRPNIKMDATQGIYIFVKDDTVPAPFYLMGDLYEKYKDEDGFLYITYDIEKTFG